MSNFVKKVDGYVDVNILELLNWPEGHAYIRPFNEDDQQETQRHDGYAVCSPTGYTYRLTTKLEEALQYMEHEGLIRVVVQ